MVHTIRFDAAYRELAALIDYDDPCKDARDEMWGYFRHRLHPMYDPKDKSIPRLASFTGAAAKVGFDIYEIRAILDEHPFAIDAVIAELLGLDELVAKPPKKRKQT